MNARISVITLGVRDLDWARRFYEEGLGWTVHLEEGSWVTYRVCLGEFGSKEVLTSTCGAPITDYA